jgi:hypothetical protein
VFEVGPTTAVLQSERVFSLIDTGLEQRLMAKAAGRLTNA